MAESIKICKHNIDGFGSCDIAADGVCVQGPCHAEDLVEYAPVVRCKECRKFKTYACRMVASGYDDFCSYGELMDGGDLDGR